MENQTGFRSVSNWVWGVIGVLVLVVLLAFMYLQDNGINFL